MIWVTKGSDANHLLRLQRDTQKRKVEPASRRCDQSCSRFKFVA